MNGTDDPDDELSNTISLTICLDDEKNDEDFGRQISFFDTIEEPSTSGLCQPVDGRVLLADLPTVVVRELQRRLNPPAVGSMRNWEFVAMSLGLSLDEIAALRAQPYAMQHLLQTYRALPFNTLLAAIKDARRVDLLISLKPHLRALKPTDRRAPAVDDFPLAPASPFDSALLNTSTFDSRSISAPVRAAPKQPPANFVLVTHHETSREARRAVKTLIASLDAWGKGAGVDVVDVNKCVDEVDLHGTLLAHFNQARQIVLVPSRLYEEQVFPNQPPTHDQQVQLKRQLHHLMEQDCLKHGGNHRFRVVAVDRADIAHRPVGWATNTLYFLFPEQKEEIGRKLFGSSNK